MLSDRTFLSEACGNVLDRDLNAALNFAACGDRRSGLDENPGETTVVEAGTRPQLWRVHKCLSPG